MTKIYLIPPHVRHGLSREAAAEYLSIGVTLFDQLVADERMPRPKTINSRRVWSRPQLEIAFALLPEAGQDENCESNPFADACV